MSTELIEQHVTDDGHGLGAQHSPPDPRDRDYLARMRFGPAAVDEPMRKHRKHYTEHMRFDQGRIGQCALKSAAHIAAAGPITQRPYYTNRPHFDTVAAYCESQALDKKTYGWPEPTFCEDGRTPGGRGDWGTTMRSAAQTMRGLGFFGNFWWLQSAHEARVYLTNVAPLWFASYWSSGMSRPDANGFIWPTGGRLGGHAYVMDEIVWGKKYVWVLNSWGTGWGIRGRAKLTFDAMDQLFAEWGEAVGVTEVRKAA